jgi:hypothetical protein
MPPDPLVELAELPGVNDAVAQARDAIDRLRGHAALRRAKEVVAAESIVRGARASAGLEGVSWTLDEVRAADRRGTRRGSAVVVGALRATAEIGALVPTWARAPRQALARLHALAAAQLTSPDDLGRLRADPSIAHRLDDLSRVLTTPSPAPAVVVAAVVEGELMSLRPFESGSGVVARAAARLVLRTRGLDPDGVSVPEVGRGDPADYADAIAAYAGNGATGVAGWIVATSNAVIAGAQEGIAICESIARG